MEAKSKFVVGLKRSNRRRRSTGLQMAQQAAPVARNFWREREISTSAESSGGRSSAASSVAGATPTTSVYSVSSSKESYSKAHAIPFSAPTAAAGGGGQTAKPSPANNKATVPVSTKYQSKQGHHIDQKSGSAVTQRSTPAPSNVPVRAGRGGPFRKAGRSPKSAESPHPTTHSNAQTHKMKGSPPLIQTAERELPARPGSENPAVGGGSAAPAPPSSSRNSYLEAAKRGSKTTPTSSNRSSVASFSPLPAPGTSDDSGPVPSPLTAENAGLLDDESPSFDFDLALAYAQSEHASASDISRASQPDVNAVTGDAISSGQRSQYVEVPAEIQKPRKESAPSSTLPRPVMREKPRKSSAPPERRPPQHSESESRAVPSPLGGQAGHHHQLRHSRHQHQRHHHHHHHAPNGHDHHKQHPLSVQASAERPFLNQPSQQEHPQHQKLPVARTQDSVYGSLPQFKDSSPSFPSQKQASLLQPDDQYGLLPLAPAAAAAEPSRSSAADPAEDEVDRILREEAERADLEARKKREAEERAAREREEAQRLAAAKSQSQAQQQNRPARTNDEKLRIAQKLLLVKLRDCLNLLNDAEERVAAIETLADTKDPLNSRWLKAVVQAKKICDRLPVDQQAREEQFVPISNSYRDADKRLEKLVVAVLQAIFVVRLKLESLRRSMSGLSIDISGLKKYAPLLRDLFQSLSIS